MELMIPQTNDLSTAIKTMLDEVSEELATWDDRGVIDSKVEEIPHEQYSGFIPWTNGGWTGTAYVGFQNGKDAWKAMAYFAEQDEKMMFDELREQLRKELADDDVLDETIFDTMSNDLLVEHFNTKYEEFEQEWATADSDTFFLNWRAIYYSADNRRNKSGEDEIYFFAGVNTDFNYGRDSISWLPGSTYATEYETNVKVSELTSEKIAEIKKAIIGFFGAA